MSYIFKYIFNFIYYNFSYSKDEWIYAIVKLYDSLLKLHTNIKVFFITSTLKSNNDSINLKKDSFDSNSLPKI